MALLISWFARYTSPPTSATAAAEHKQDAHELFHTPFYTRCAASSTVGAPLEGDRRQPAAAFVLSVVSFAHPKQFFRSTAWS